MEAGKLDRTITLQRQVEAVAASGAVTKTWTNLITVRAEVRLPTAEEVTQGFGVAERQTVMFVVRWSPTPIATGDRILFAGRTFDLKEIVEIGRRRCWTLRGVAQ